MYVKADINGVEMKRVLVNNGAGVNILPLRTLKKIGLEIHNLEKADAIMTDFVGHDRALEGFIMLNVKVGKHELHGGFFVMDVKTNYNVLLGRDWIHSNACVLSSLHQMLFIWRPEGDVEVIHGDPSPFGEEAFHAEAMC